MRKKNLFSLIGENEKAILFYFPLFMHCNLTKFGNAIHLLLRLIVLHYLREEYSQFGVIELLGRC